MYKNECFYVFRGRPWYILGKRFLIDYTLLKFHVYLQCFNFGKFFLLISDVISEV